MKALIASVALVGALTLPALAQNQPMPPNQQPADPPIIQQQPQAPGAPQGTIGQEQRVQPPVSGEQAFEKKDLGTDPDPRVRQDLQRAKPGQ